VEASAKNGAHDGNSGAKAMRARPEEMRGREGLQGRHMAKGDKRRRQERRRDGRILVGG
jgi:hypothetical protein